MADANVCSPARSGNFAQSGTCLELSELQSVAALYNKNNSHNPIPTFIWQSVTKLKAELDQRFESCQGQEHCWIEQPFVKQSLELYTKLKNVFKPAKPASWKRNRHEWLNTYDILYVMKQYVDAHPTFEFLGVFPVDFQEKVGNDRCVVQSMCGFNINDFLKRGKLSFGVVFNLDRHDQPGSHWVACYGCFDPTNVCFGMCYFDSIGKKPPKEIFNFMKSIKDQCKTVFNATQMKQFVTKYNCTQKQFKNSECGIFSMVFLKLCLELKGKNYRAIRRQIGHDDDIHKFRDILYAPMI